VCLSILSSRRLGHQHNVHHVESAAAADTLGEDSRFVAIVIETNTIIFVHTIRLDTHDASRILYPHRFTIASACPIQSLVKEV
jgi:hypothetical protein